MNGRSIYNVAAGARLYRTLADRGGGYLTEDAGERFEQVAAARPYGLGEVEGDLVAAASDLDRLCGWAVHVLRKRVQVDLLDVLGVLPVEQIAAVAFALPEKVRRAIVKRDPYWRRAVEAVEEEKLKQAEELIDAVNDYAQGQDERFREYLPPEVAQRIERLNDGNRRIALGLPHGLSLDELVELVELYEAHYQQPTLAAVE